MLFDGRVSSNVDFGDVLFFNLAYGKDRAFDHGVGE